MQAIQLYAYRQGSLHGGKVTTPHPYREGASTVLHRCCVAPQPVGWFRSTRERWNALLPLSEPAPGPKYVRACIRGNALLRNRQTRLCWQGAYLQYRTQSARLRARRHASPALKGLGMHAAREVRMVGMRVLVTGGAGYIGSVIVEELASAGHEPVVYDTFAKGHAGALDPAVPVVHGDVLDTARMRETMERHQIDAVIHMAGLIEVGLSVTRPEAFFVTNMGGSIGVVSAMVAAGVKRFVFSSTAALYGDPERLPIAEDEPTRPTNPYGESKLMVERMLAWVAPAHGLACTALRYFNAAGATERNGEDHDPETHLIPLVLRAAAQGQPVSVLGTDYPTPDGTGRSEEH